MYIRIKYVLTNLALPVQVTNWCIRIVLYRQYMHEVFHSFPPISLSRVTTWWRVTSCSDWWRWLSHASTTHCALKCTCNKLWGGTASHIPHTLTYTVHMHWWYIPLLAMYVHGTHWSILTAHIIVWQAMRPLHIICMAPLYVNTYICIYGIPTYRQYMHEVFLSFLPTSPSRVTIWWGVISCSEWWRWLCFEEEQPHTYNIPSHTLYTCTGDIYHYLLCTYMGHTDLYLQLT